jgi:hypothetical protein
MAWKRRGSPRACIPPEAHTAAKWKEGRDPQAEGVGTILTDFLAGPPNRVRFRWARDFLLARAIGLIHDTNVPARRHEPADPRRAGALGNHWHLIGRLSQGCGGGRRVGGGLCGRLQQGISIVFDAWLVWKTLRGLGGKSKGFGPRGRVRPSYFRLELYHKIVSAWGNGNHSRPEEGH